MSVLVVGLSHRTAPLAMLERIALPADLVPHLGALAVSGEHVTEALVLSTCNRLEVYSDVEKFHGGVAEISERFALATGATLDQLTPHLYVHYEERAVQHLFEVACGLDSMVVGESQILGQVRHGLRGAQEAGSAGRVLNELVQHALRVGKRAHSETKIDEAGRSLVSVALDVAERELGSLADRPALVVGAGSLSALAATSLRRRGAGELVILNRTPERAHRLAEVLDARAGGLDGLEKELAVADLVLTCTGSLDTIIDADVLARAGAGREGDPLVVLDLALPRDVATAAGALPGIVLVDLEHLAGLLADAAAGPDVAAAHRIVAEEVTAFLGWQRASSVAPTVVALRAMASDVVDSELARLSSRLPGLDEVAREEIARSVRRVVDKLLHSPTARVKELAGEPGGLSYAAALRELFDLDQAAVEVVTSLAAEGSGVRT